MRGIFWREWWMGVRACTSSSTPHSLKFWHDSLMFGRGGLMNRQGDVSRWWVKGPPTACLCSLNFFCSFWLGKCAQWGWASPWPPLHMGPFWGGALVLCTCMVQNSKETVYKNKTPLEKPTSLYCLQWVRPAKPPCRSTSLRPSFLTKSLRLCYSCGVLPSDDDANWKPLQWCHDQIDASWK